MDFEIKENTNVIIVTGVAGFIGFSLTLCLLKQGVTVIGIDNLTGEKKQNVLQDQRLSFLMKFDSFVFLKHDLSLDCTLLTSWFNSVHTVIHLAASPGVRDSIEHPERYIRNNIVAFSHVIHLAAKCHVKHFVFASSSSVYGNHIIPKDGISEDMVNDTPKSIYAMTKRQNELEAYVVSNSTDMKITGLRFFSVYGKWGRPDMAPWIFAKAMLQKEPVVLYSGGLCKRDFTYIDDVVNAISAIIHLERKRQFEIYNIGSSSPHTVKELANFIQEETNCKAIFSEKPLPIADVSITHANMSKFNRDYGEICFVNFRTGIKQFCTWFKTYDGLQTDRLS